MVNTISQTRDGVEADVERLWYSNWLALELFPASTITRVDRIIDPTDADLASASILGDLEYLNYRDSAAFRARTTFMPEVDQVEDWLSARAVKAVILIHNPKDGLDG